MLPGVANRRDPWVTERKVKLQVGFIFAEACIADIARNPGRLGNDDLLVDEGRAFRQGVELVLYFRRSSLNWSCGNALCGLSKAD